MGLRVAFAGTPEFAVPALRALHAAGLTLVGVLTRPDRPRGRGQHLAASPVKEAALQLELACSQPERLAGEAEHAALRAWQPDVLVVVAYGLILPPAVLSLPRLGCVNAHASLLPRWRGAAPIQRAILAGDARTGITIMQMDAGLDTGPVLLERPIELAEDETAASLSRRLGELAGPALVDALAGLASGTLRPRPQAGGQATYAGKIQKSEARIDWRRDALAVERQVRAFNPWPIAEARWQDEPLRIFKARALADSTAAAAEPGRVLGIGPAGITVACGRGRLAIQELQRPGRKAVSAAEFARAVTLAGQRLG